MIASPQAGVVVLSRGSNWNPPSILPQVGDVWPTGAETYCVFYDSAGDVLANVTGIVLPGSIDYSVPNAQLDSVPAGAGFEMFVVTTDGTPHKIRYGTVFRHEVRFSNTVAPAVGPLTFSDTLQRTALGNSWVPVLGGPQLFANGPNEPAFSAAGNGGASLSTSPIPITHVIGANDDVLLVAVELYTTGVAGVSVTVGGTPLHPVGAMQYFNSGYDIFNSPPEYAYDLYVFGLIATPDNPLPTGSQTIEVAFSNCSIITANSCSYTAVTEFGSPLYASGGGTTAAHTVNGTPGETLFQVFGNASNGGNFSGYNQNLRSNQNYLANSNWALLLGDAPVGVAGAVNFSAAISTSDWWGSVVIPLIGLPLTYGAGAPNVGSGSSDAAMRWLQPLNTDNVQATVNLLNAGHGTTGVILCSDINMTSGLVAQFDSTNNQIYAGTLNGNPGAVTNQGTPVSNTVALLPDSYTVTYNNNTGLLAIYKGASTTPIFAWPDVGQIVPHGPGHRYVGLNWLNPAASNGTQVTGWAAQDTAS
ncbi:LtfC-like domain-containing protein [Mycobacterium malmoense]|uniref:LtfC-like domain-containing protein n=1 Tax=Mycobacterium malmoense TaxID=1780 RepID=UPI00114D4C20|nr:hypothetical protein [Mycobacterium malmoense]